MILMGRSTVLWKVVRDFAQRRVWENFLARGFELSSNTVLVQAVYDNYKTILRSL
jgi:hypothetical protein